MAITYSAGTGTLVTSFAMNETLGSQTQQTGNNTVVVSNTISAAGNGQIGTKYSTYVGRLVVINLAGTQQKRLVISQSAGTGTTQILTVHEDWDTNPVATTDTIHVFYDIDDLETGGAGGGIALSAKTGLYELSNVLTVQSAGGLQLCFGTGLEVDDQGASVGFIVAGRFDCGYTQAGTPINGGIITGYNNADNEPWIQWQSGSTGDVNDTLFWAQLKLQQWQHQNGAAVTYRGCKIISGTYYTELFDATVYDTKILGESTTNELVRLDAGSTVEGLVLASTAGLTTASGDTTTETLTARDVIFAGNSPNLTVNSNKTWNIINPTWTIDTSSQSDISFLTGTSNSVNEKYSLDLVVQDPSGTAISSPRVFLYEGTIGDTLTLDLTGDSNGVVSSSWIYITYVDNAGTSLTTTTYGTHALRVFSYTKTPFIAAQASNAFIDSTITLTTDNNITETTQATAISNGSGITPVFHRTGETDPRPMKVLKYDGGTGSVPTVGETVTSSSATGVVVEYIGDAVSGTLVLDTWNGTEFTDNQGITGGTSSFSATTDTAGFYDEYTLEIDCNNKNLTVVYDYVYAKLAQSTLDSIWQTVHEWGNRNQAAPVYLGTSGYYTERSGTEGVWLSNLGTGTVSYMTADDGTQYIPPVQYTFALTGLVSGSAVSIFNASTQDEITGTESSGTTFSYNYIYGGDVNIYVVILHLDYNYIRLTGLTLSNSSQTIPLQLATDRWYSNP